MADPISSDTNTIYINSISQDYIITSNPGFNMQGFFSSSNKSTHNINSVNYIPSNFNIYTSTARQWAQCFNGRNDLTSIPDYNMSNATNMANTFQNCTLLTTSPTIPSNITNMAGTFMNCQALTSAPSIPSGVVNMSNTFWNCRNLTEAPLIPNTVTYLANTFVNCVNLTNMPVIPDNVINMANTFRACTKLVNLTNIPASVNYMGYTFRGSNNITGDIYIFSNNVTCATYCFYGHNSRNILNVHCYAGTTTFNSFNSYLKGTDNSNLNVHIITI